MLPDSLCRSHAQCITKKVTHQLISTERLRYPNMTQYNHVDTVLSCRHGPTPPFSYMAQTVSTRSPTLFSYTVLDMTLASAFRAAGVAAVSMFRNEGQSHPFSLQQASLPPRHAVAVPDLCKSWDQAAKG
jgi:hypothetical protein